MLGWILIGIRDWKERPLSTLPALIAVDCHNVSLPPSPGSIERVPGTTAMSRVAMAKERMTVP
jgi:hypothetical protein